MLFRPHVMGSYWTSNISRKSYDDRIYDLTGTRPNCYLRSSHVSSSSFATFCAWKSMNPLISTCCVSPSTGEDHHEDRISPFNQVQEYWDRLQKEFFREWYRGHCPSPIQLEMLYSRLLFARPMMMFMMMMKLFNGGIQHDKSIHLIIRHWNDFHSETSFIMFLYVFRVYLMPKRHFLCRTSHSGFE